MKDIRSASENFAARIKRKFSLFFDNVNDVRRPNRFAGGRLRPRDARRRLSQFARCVVLQEEAKVKGTPKAFGEGMGRFLNARSAKSGQALDMRSKGGNVTR
jgi:hypothetical protein